MQRLTSVPLAGHAVLLPAGLDHAAARETLASLLARATGPETAGLFAAVAREGEALVFSAPPGRVARFAELDAEGRELLRAEIGRLASELRRAAETAARRDPARDGHLPALVAAAVEVPSFELVFAHEGRPVLAGWGLAPAGAPNGLRLIQVLDDGRLAERPRPIPWAGLGAGAVVLALLGGAAAAATPWIAALLAPEPPVCRAAPGDMDALRDLMREQEREQQLRRRLASLQEELGRRRASCPLPEAPPLRLAEPVPPPRRRSPSRHRRPRPHRSRRPNHRPRRRRRLLHRRDRPSGRRNAHGRSGPRPSRRRTPSPATRKRAAAGAASRKRATSSARPRPSHTQRQHPRGTGPHPRVPPRTPALGNAGLRIGARRHLLRLESASGRVSRGLRGDRRGDRNARLALNRLGLHPRLSGRRRSAGRRRPAMSARPSALGTTPQGLRGRPLLSEVRYRPGRAPS
jgi:hypothetical protein